MAVRAEYSGHPKIVIVYDREEQTFFGHIVKEALDKLHELDAGKKLLVGIANARPTFQGGGALGFEEGAHVAIFRPDDTLKITPRGFKYGGSSDKDEGLNYFIDSYFEANQGSDALWQGGASSHYSVNMATAENGEGSVSKVYFSNSRLWLSSGLVNPPFVALGHELIHAWHSLFGIKKNTTDEEENFTVGLAEYKDAPLTENVIRQQANVKLRKTY